jgi:hypothetical protein
MVRDDTRPREEIRDGLVPEGRETGFLFHIIRKPFKELVFGPDVIQAVDFRGWGCLGGGGHLL